VAELVLLLFAVLLFANGALMVYEPVQWLCVHNWINSKLMGSSEWFRFKSESVRSGADRWATRLVGGAFLFMSVMMLQRVILSLAGIRVRESALPAAQVHTRHRPPASLELAVLSLVVGFGVALVIRPSEASRVLGANRYFRASFPIWVWRTVGIGFILAGGIAVLAR
jgi:hypothetical protein